MRRTPAHASAAQAKEPFRRALPLAAAALVLALLAQAGLAYAYLSSGGSGTGYATVGRPVSITVSAATPASGLYPGTTGGVYFTVTNPNAFELRLTKVTEATIVGSSGTCPPTNLAVTGLPAVALTVSAGATTGTETIPRLVMLSPTAPTSCQGVTFTVSLTLTGVSG